MRVEIHVAVLASPEEHGRDLAAIVDTFSRGQHQWIIADPDAVLASRWVTLGAKWDASLLAELVEKTWRAAVDEPPASPPAPVMLIGLSSGPSEVLPSRAREILEEPAYVVLEDATSDWHFLRALATAFDADVILKAMDRRWLRAEHGGGAGGILKRVDALLERGVAAFRLMAVADSDRLMPGPSPQKTRRLAADLEARAVRAIVLHKREIENYLPDTLIDHPKHHDAWVSLLSLTRTQRDYFDMKAGFKKDKATGEIDLGEQESLFVGANPWHLRRLSGGFGKRIGERFEGAVLTRAEMTLVCETAPDEIESILRAIEEML